MTTIVDEPSSVQNPNPALERLRIVLAAASLPFTLAVLLSALFYLIGDYTIVERVPAKTEFASITTPNKNTMVGSSFMAQGSIEKLPPRTTAYLMVKRDERYWPKKDLGQTASQWSHTIKEAKQERSKLYLVILALEAADKTLIDQWYDTAQKTSKYPGITTFSSAREIAATEVKQ